MNDVKNTDSQSDCDAYIIAYTAVIFNCFIELCIFAWVLVDFFVNNDKLQNTCANHLTNPEKGIIL